MKCLILITLFLIVATPTLTTAQQKTLETYEAEASEYIKQGRHQEAVEALRQVTRLKPDDAIAHYYLGIELNLLGSFSEASESLSRVIEMKPKMSEAHRELSVVRHNLKQYSQAVE